MIWTSLIGLGDLVVSVSGEITVDLSWAVAGEGVVVEVDHSEDNINESSSLLAKFKFAEQPRFAAVGGAVIRAVLDGTDGDKFRVEIVRTNTPEYVYEYSGSPEEEPAYPGIGTGVITLSWIRYGVLDSDAESA
jgi:hypothetical protein